MSAALLGIVLLRRRRLHVDADFRRRMACIVLATALMGVAIAGMQALLTMFPDGNTSSIRSLTIMAILVVCGLASMPGCCGCSAVVRIDEIFSKDRREQ